MTFETLPKKSLSLPAMAKFLFKRLLLFIPTLLVVSVLTFFLSKSAPGDPVEKAIELDDMTLDTDNYRSLYQQTAENMGLDKPVFYLQITTAAFPDSLRKIYPKSQQKTLTNLIEQYGNWPAISKYYHLIIDIEHRFNALPDSIINAQKSKIKPNIKQLYLQSREKSIRYHLGVLQQNIESTPILFQVLGAKFEALKDTYQEILNTPTNIRRWLPKIYWHGTNNQYHNWLINILKGNLGTSLVDGRPVSAKIMDALRWTLLLNGIAIFLAYGIAITLGIFTAVRKNSRWDRWTTYLLFMLHSLPNFWIAILLIVFFTNPEFGMDWFPAYGLGDIPFHASYWQIVKIRAAHLILPIICITFPALAFISRQMRGAMINVLEKDYIRTAKAKGVPRKKIILKHAFRNALFPIITLFASILPAAISGSIVIEHIFSIPGMGRLMIKSINQQDWPVVFGILILASILTIIGLLIADLLYAWADPRVKLDKK